MARKIKILVPVDFSRYSVETINFALSLGEFVDPELILLHVVPAGEVETFATLGGEPGTGLKARLEKAGGELAREVEAWREKQPGLDIDWRVAGGVPFKEICRVAEEEGIQLLVIGTHGRTGLAHLLIGSTAERVVQHAPCPVLTIKPRMF